MAFRTGLDVAAFVIGAGLAGALIADMHDHPGQEFVEVVEPVHYCRTDPLLKPSTAFNLVRVHLNLHRASSFY
ncbi:hypothetical protein D3C84_933270 [compost metagenome]